MTPFEERAGMSGLVIVRLDVWLGEREERYPSDFPTQVACLVFIEQDNTYVDGCSQQHRHQRVGSQRCSNPSYASEFSLSSTFHVNAVETYNLRWPQASG
jgi:hypothetical protein